MPPRDENARSVRAEADDQGTARGNLQSRHGLSLPGAWTGATSYVAAEIAARIKCRRPIDPAVDGAVPRRQQTGFESQPQSEGTCSTNKQSAMDDTNTSDMEFLFEDACYANTIGEFDKAFILFSELAQRGHIDALVGLATMHLRGEGTPQDSVRGLELLERAASLGHSTAAFNLGALYRNGDCKVPRDFEKSKRFFILAKELGCQLPVEDYLQ